MLSHVERKKVEDFAVTLRFLKETIFPKPLLPNVHYNNDLHFSIDYAHTRYRLARHNLSSTILTHSISLFVSLSLSHSISLFFSLFVSLSLSLSLSLTLFLSFSLSLYHSSEFFSQLLSLFLSFFNANLYYFSASISFPFSFLSH